MPNIKVEQAKFFNKKYICSQKTTEYQIIRYFKLDLMRIILGQYFHNVSIVSLFYIKIYRQEKL